MKRQTKTNRERAEKAALRQRLTDLAQGALGHCCLPDGDESRDHGGMAAEMGLDVFSRWVGAVQATFGSDDLALDKVWMLGEYDYISKVTEYLFERGVRP